MSRPTAEAGGLIRDSNRVPPDLESSTLPTELVLLLLLKFYINL